MRNIREVLFNRLIHVRACAILASYPGSNYAGEGKRAWYLPFAVVLDFTGISVNSILSVFFR